MTRALPLLLLLLAGCQTVVEAPADQVDRRATYQLIADVLPRASFGWGSPPGIVAISAAVKAEQPWPEPRPLMANETGFRMHYEGYRPRDVWIPYTALRQASYRWMPFPNAILLPLLVVPLQGIQTQLVIDTREVPSLFDTIMSDVDRLEVIGKQVGSGGPWSHAQGIKRSMNEDVAAHGVGMLTIELDFLAAVPPWIPIGGRAEETARAFAWAQAHPNEPTLPDAPEPSEPE